MLNTFMAGLKTTFGKVVTTTLTFVNFGAFMASAVSGDYGSVVLFAVFTVLMGALAAISRK